MSPFQGVYTIKCAAGRITPSRGALLQWGTCAEARVTLFEQLAQFSPACTSAHRSERVVPHRGGIKTRAAPDRIIRKGLNALQTASRSETDEQSEKIVEQKRAKMEILGVFDWAAGFPRHAKCDT